MNTPTHVYNKNKQLFLFANFISYLGNGIQIIAAAYITLVTTNSIVDVGMLFVLISVPQVVISLYAGKFSDTASKKRLCIWSDILRALSVLAIPVAIYTDTHPIAVIYIASFLVASLDSVYTPVSNAWIMDLLDHKDHTTYSSKFEFTTQIAMLASAAAGGFFVDWFGATAVFGFNALTYLVSALLFSLMNETSSQQPTSAEPQDGAEEKIAWARVLPAVFLFSHGRTIPTVMNTLTVFIVIQIFEEGMGILGVTDALAGFSFMLAAACYPLFARRFSATTLTYAGLLLCSAFIWPQPLLGSKWLMLSFALATFVFGLSRVGTRIWVMDVTVKRHAGQVFGASNAIGLFLGAVGTMAVTWVVTHTDIRVGYACVAAFLFVSTVIVHLAQRYMISTAKHSVAKSAV